MILNLNLKNININIIGLKIFLIGVFTYYTYIKIANYKVSFDKKQIINIFFIGIISIVTIYIKYRIDYTISIIFYVFLLSLLGSKCSENRLGYSILTVLISLSINYTLYFLEISITFIINSIYTINYDYINFIIMMLIHLFLLYRIGKMKRIKYGIAYLNRKNKSDDYFDIIVLNMSVIIVFSFIILANTEENSRISRNLVGGFCIFALIMFSTIKKSIQLYYKQKLIIQDLNETKNELEKSKQEIQILEKENIELSKKNHSFSHKYKALEYKLNQQIFKAEIADEFDLKSKLNDLSKEIYVIPKNTELEKTGIPDIDDMLKFMQSECDKHRIIFNLQVIGNIYYMTNNIIPKEELEILLADHIKDAIIAINHSNNINKSILVKLGNLEDCYGLYIYDSGIEFEEQTLENLGKKPITTYINEGGSGMGFMNTFDTLLKHNASLIIEELGTPCKENFTKIIKIRFDGNNEFKVISYRR